MKFLMHPVLPAQYPVTGHCISCINFKATNVGSARFTDHKKFNMEPVWLFGVVTLEMDPAFKRTLMLSSRDSSFPGLYFVQKFLCIMSTIGLTKNRGSWSSFSPQWVGLIWIADVKIPQDVLKMISGHVVTKKWHVEECMSLLQYCSREFFLRIPITIR